jgi:hypothetical protein
VILSLGLIAIGWSGLLWHTVHRGASEETQPTSTLPGVTVAPLNEPTTQFLRNRDTEWMLEPDTKAIVSETMKAAGITPSLQNLTNYLVSPKHSPSIWEYANMRLHSQRALGRYALARARDTYLESAERSGPFGRTIFVSEDGRVGLLWLSTNAVKVFEQGPTKSMQDALYLRNSE